MLQFVRWRCGFLSIAVLLFGASAAAQKLDTFFSTPMPEVVVTPKIEKPKPVLRRSPFALDRSVWILGLVQGGAELTDGILTHRYVHACQICDEEDRIARPLLGRKPTWQGMIFYGSLEDIGTAYLSQRLRQSRHRFVRAFAPVPSLWLSTIHLNQGLHLLADSTNDCPPNQHDTGTLCVKNPNTQSLRYTMKK
ncbi:MAG TPA: hypothetical protein VGI16_11470 [Candidatus Acidoferrum sp.]|jgi:hypothetical protein